VYPLERAILDLKKSKICSIPKNTLGPVYSISHAFDHIPDDEEVVISYCDLTQIWDFDTFLEHCRNSNSDGCLVTHVGFHPHKLYNQSFAFLTVDGDNVKFVHEKKPIKDVSPSEPASNGIYYFKSGKLMKQYFNKLMTEKVSVNGEYYVTLPYNLMIRDGLKVTHYNTDSYICLGTPADVICFESWINIIKHNNLLSSDASVVFKYWQKYVASTKS
jgi:dTDP-glucose pyrophosphorylase